MNPSTIKHNRENCYHRIFKAVSEARHPEPPPEGLFQPTAVIALFSFDPEASLLFIQKADTKGYPWANQMAFPGGHYDPDDVTRMETALRELSEETSIERDNVEVIGSLGHFQTINNKDIEAFAGFWNREGNILYDAEEISRVFQIPLKTLMITHLSKSYHQDRPDIYSLTYPYEDVVIWGVTAKIVYHLIQILL